MKTASAVKFMGMVASGMVLAATFSAAYARDGFGFGVILGEPTGLSAKKWMSDVVAYDGGIAWSFSENASVQVHSDILIHKYGVLTNDVSSVQTPFYYGIGARIKLEEGGGSGRNDNDSLLGIRVPLGINYLYADSPFEFFAEIVPILDLLPDSDFDFNFALGVRYYFD